MRLPIRYSVAIAMAAAWLAIETGPATTGAAAAEAADQPAVRLQALQRRIDATVRERCILQSASVQEIRSPVATTILYVVPEGSTVKKGDLLIELDSSSLQEESAKQAAAAVEVGVQGEALEHTVRWQRAESLDALRGETIALKLYLRNAEAFSFWFE